MDMLTTFVLSAIVGNLSKGDFNVVLSCVTLASLFVNLHVVSKISELKVYIHENFVRKGPHK